MNFQETFDALSAAERAKRSESQMTLLELITALEAMPADATVEAITDPHSYRGYYDDLAFERGAGRRLVAEVLKDARDSLGKTFEGYKGGDYVMGKTAPIWISGYGLASGLKLKGFDASGALVTEQEEWT